MNKCFAALRTQWGSIVTEKRKTGDKKMASLARNSLMSVWVEVCIHDDKPLLPCQQNSVVGTTERCCPDNKSLYIRLQIVGETERYVAARCAYTGTIGPIATVRKVLERGM